MSHHPMSQRWLDRWFTLVLIGKGIDGVLETIGGAILLFVSHATLTGLLGSLAHFDLVTDHDIIARGVLALDHSLSSGGQLFGALYLLIHGLVKIGLVWALLSRRYHWYPYAIGVLVAFTLYQIYQLFTMFSLGIVVLTILDFLVIWLTILEYRRHQGWLPEPAINKTDK